MKRVHLMPYKDIAINHRINDCPCNPKPIQQEMDGEQCLVHMHKYQDGQEAVNELCKQAGVKYNEVIYKKVIPK